jgi:hypothetical protein
LLSLDELVKYTALPYASIPNDDEFEDEVALFIRSSSRIVCHAFEFP